MLVKPHQCAEGVQLRRHQIRFEFLLQERNAEGGESICGDQTVAKTQNKVFWQDSIRIIHRLKWNGISSKALDQLYFCTKGDVANLDVIE